MERPKPSTIGWSSLIAGVAAYDMFCPNGQTLSEAVDRGLESRYKHFVRLGIGVTALHLANVFTTLNMDHLDPIHQLTRLKSERPDDAISNVS